MNNVLRSIHKMVFMKKRISRIISDPGYPFGMETVYAHVL